MNEPELLRPRRSVLYMPGSNRRALDKARQLPADGLIMDLEDAVAPDAKEVARAQVLAALAEGGFGRREVAVRINSLATPWGPADLAAVAASGADALVLPKVESVEELAQADDGLRQAGAPPELSLWAMIETPRGVASVEAIAASGGRLRVLVMGTADLARALRLPDSPARAGLLPSLGRCVLAARAADLDILDGVCLQLDDAAGLEHDCGQGRELGFDGKTLIHPSQIAPANLAFGVSDAEAAKAQRLIAGWEVAAGRDQGVAVVEGRLVEALHVAQARRLLGLHRACQDR